MKLRLVGAVFGVAGCLAFAGCGSSNSSSSSSGGNPQSGAAGSASASHSAVVTAAEAAVKQYEAPQPPVSVPTITRAVPKNVRLAILSFSNNPSAVPPTNAAVTAAKKLGWSVKVYYATLTPEGYQSTWASMLQGNPTAIFSIASGFPNTLIASQLKQAQARHIPIVSEAPYTTDAAPAGALATVSGPLMRVEDGKLMGDVIVADAKGPANVLFVYAPAFEGLLGPIRTAFTKVIEAAGGQVSGLQVTAADIGQAIPGQVVNFLQQHPQVKYVVFVVAQVDAGVLPALAAAGLAGKVKIVSDVPLAANMAAVKNGQEFAMVGDEDYAAGWRAIDDMLRILTGQKNYQVDPSGWHQIFVKSNVTETSAAPQGPGVPGAYLKAWHLPGS